jgi:hypothetical protein
LFGTDGSHNAVHGSDAPSSAEREIKCIFGDTVSPNPEPLPSDEANPAEQVAPRSVRQSQTVAPAALAAKSDQVLNMILGEPVATASGGDFTSSNNPAEAEKVKASEAQAPAAEEPVGGLPKTESRTNLSGSKGQLSGSKNQLAGSKSQLSGSKNNLSNSKHQLSGSKGNMVQRDSLTGALVSESDPRAGFQEQRAAMGSKSNISSSRPASGKAKKSGLDNIKAESTNGLSKSKSVRGSTGILGKSSPRSSKPAL